MDGHETTVVVSQPCDGAPSIYEVRLGCGHIFFFPAETSIPTVGCTAYCSNHKTGDYSGALRWLPFSEPSVNP